MGRGGGSRHPPSIRYREWELLCLFRRRRPPSWSGSTKPPSKTRLRRPSVRRRFQLRGEGRRGKGGGIPAMRRRAHKRGGGKRRRKMHFWKDVVAGRQPTERAFPNRPTKDRKKREGRKYKGASLRAPSFPYPKAVKYCPSSRECIRSLGLSFFGQVVGLRPFLYRPSVPLGASLSSGIRFN